MSKISLVYINEKELEIKSPVPDLFVLYTDDGTKTVEDTQDTQSTQDTQNVKDPEDVKEKVVEEITKEKEVSQKEKNEWETNYNENTQIVGPNVCLSFDRILYRTNGDIYKGKINGINCIIKITHKKWNTVPKEAEILRALDTIGFKRSPKLFAEFKTEDHYYMVVEQCGDDLMNYMLKKGIGYFRPEQLIPLLLELVSRLHHIGIAHLDLSFENVCLHKGKLILIDFAVCYVDPNSKIASFIKKDYLLPEQNTIIIKSSEDKYDTVIRTTKVLGKDKYIAPEVYERHPFNPYLADSWSVGIMAYCLIRKNFPFYYPDPKKDPLAKLFKIRTAFYTNVSNAKGFDAKGSDANDSNNTNGSNDSNSNGSNYTLEGIVERLVGWKVRLRVERALKLYLLTKKEVTSE